MFMDFWVVAAATGVGYVAKNWQNISISADKDGSPKLSPRLHSDTCRMFGKMPNSVFTLSPKLSRKCLLYGDDYSDDEEHNKVEMNLQDLDELQVSDSPPIFIEKQVLQDNTHEINKKQNSFDSFGHRLHKIRTKNKDIKSFSSLKPLVVAGNSRDCQRKQATQVDYVNDHNIVFTDENEEFFEPAGSVKLPRRRPKQMCAKKFKTRSHPSQVNNTVPLFIGITIGILSNMVTYQREVELLNDLLEQAENMVQDLHTKLETKEGFSTTNKTATNTSKDENFELTSEIEAELEAELERLEENMKGCNQKRPSTFVEIESDFEADIAHEDLNLDSLTWKLDSRSESNYNDQNNKSESTENQIFTPNYAVSPVDLRLRLHEVIESELRARIKELESVLKNQNKQSKPHSPQAQEEEEEEEEENSFWDFDHTRIESSSSTP